MLDHTLMHNAFQSTLNGLSVCTTGSATLAATTTSYTRSTGSFITDGFRPGMEVLTTGFAANGYRIVTRVEALTLTVRDALTAETAAAARTIVCGLPEYRGWENTEVSAMPAHRCYVTDELAPSTQLLRTMPASGGVVEHTGLYVVHWYGMPGYAHMAISDCADAILALFPPGPYTTLSDGNTVRIRGAPGPHRGQIVRLETGMMVTTISIPYRAEALNS
jgi:hypothetical protein